MQQFYKFINWRFVSLNMFRAPPRPSSGAYNCINPLAYTAACEAVGLARSINAQPAVRRNSETNPTSQHNRGR